MKVAICDDEILELNNTKQQLELAYKSLDLIVDTFTNGKDLLARVKKMEYDLIILDIEMPIMNGLEIAKKIRELDIKSAICFLTSHVEYALKGYEVNAMRYLTKPVKAKQLSEVVTFLMEQKTRQKKIIIKNEDGIAFVSLNDILYMEAQNQEIRIVAEGNVYYQRYNIKDYEKELTAYFFVRCHRSYLVNLMHIAKITKKDVIMNNNEVIPLSRLKEKEVRELLIAYVKRSAI